MTTDRDILIYRYRTACAILTIAWDASLESLPTPALQSQVAFWEAKAREHSSRRVPTSLTFRDRCTHASNHGCIDLGICPGGGTRVMRKVSSEL